MIEFKPFPKIPRYRREVCVTEKIDGTNAAVQIQPIAEMGEQGSPLPLADYFIDDVPHGIWAQSRNNFVTPNHDNYGFAVWVQEHASELIKLGPGTHYGEWWGAGIQRRYGQGRKHFSLFNVARWQPGRDTPPDCCEVVPLLGYVQPSEIDEILQKLRNEGSVAAPGYKFPEGVIIWHSQSKQYYKILLEGDDVPKSIQERK